MSNPRLAAVLVLVLTVCAYLNALGNQFTYDDGDIIVRNSFIRDWRNMGLLFSPSYFVRTGETGYRPLVTVSHIVRYGLWGLNPIGWHAVNVVLHAVNAILLFSLLRRALQSVTAPLVAATAFALHPIQTEPVNSVTLGADVLAMLFMLLALRLHVASDGARQPPAASDPAGGWLYLGALLAFTLALLSKEMALSLPLLIVLYDLLLGRSLGSAQAFWERVKRRYLGFALVVMAYGGLLAAVRPESPGLAGGVAFAHRLAAMPQVMGRYVLLLLAPVNLSANYPNLPEPPVGPLSAWAWVGLAAFTVWLLFALGRKPAVSAFAAMWFFVALLPVANLFPIWNTMAERFLYIPSVGFCLFFGLWGREWPQPTSRRFRTCGRFLNFGVWLAVAVLVCLSALTAQRNSAWRDDLRLWRATAPASPRSFKAHCNLGKALYERGAVGMAEKAYGRSLALYPNNAEAEYNLGVCELARGRPSAAIGRFQRALSSNPRLVAAYSALGYASWRDGRAAESVRHYLLAADIYLANQMRPEAQAQLEEALKVAPGSPEVRKRLEDLRIGSLLQRTGGGR